MEYPPISPKIYAEGRQAAKDGKEFWECPYTASDAPITHFPAWKAGWAYQKQLDKDLATSANPAPDNN